jgi:hypothetical protein
MKGIEINGKKLHEIGIPELLCFMLRRRYNKSPVTNENICLQFIPNRLKM